MADFDNEKEEAIIDEEIVEALKSVPTIDDSEADLAETFELPDDKSVENETLDRVVSPKRKNEFICKKCNLIVPVANMSEQRNKKNICKDCE